MSETAAEAARRMLGAPNTAPRVQACALAGKHRCGGAVTLSWGQWMCVVGWLGFGDADHEGTPRRVVEWMRTKGAAT
jgi:hypothetical protein